MSELIENYFFVSIKRIKLEFAKVLQLCKSVSISDYTEKLIYFQIKRGEIQFIVCKGSAYEIK